TDFSPNRKAPLAREVRVSNSREQIDSLWSSLKEGNIKKGWELHGSTAIEVPPGEAPSAETAKEAAKPSPKKKVAADEPAAKKTTPAKKKPTAKKAAPADKKVTAKKKAAKKPAKMAPSERSQRKTSKKKTG
ncbi:MAG: hypothetical protein ACYTG0_42675, partial [Planctomycetota bacterium]